MAEVDVGITVAVPECRMCEVGKMSDERLAGSVNNSFFFGQYVNRRDYICWSRGKVVERREGNNRAISVPLNKVDGRYPFSSMELNIPHRVT
jgi:hypothetical protein